MTVDCICSLKPDSHSACVDTFLAELRGVQTELSQALLAKDDWKRLAEQLSAQVRKLESKLARERKHSQEQRV